MKQFCLPPATPIRQCLNGELSTNQTNNILYICVSGHWRPICSYFWGQVQATVACRQLNPKNIFTVSLKCSIACYKYSHNHLMSTNIGASATNIPLETQGMNIFNYQFYCTGQEMNTRDCPFNYGQPVCNSDNSVAGVECVVGKVAPTLH